MLTGLQVLEFFTDFNFILKIFVLLMIISFVLNHLGKGPMAWVIIAALSYFILWDSWKFFGPVYLLYMFLAMGFIGFIIDYFFMAQPLSAKKRKPGAEEPEGGSSKDSQEFHHQHHGHPGQGQHGGHSGPNAPRPMG